MRIYFYDAKRNIHWKLPSRERLFKRLGDYDTMAEFTILSERHFEKLCTNADSYVDFVNSKAKEYDVKIRSGVTLENYRSALYKSFMVNSYAMFCDFCYHFRDDVKIFINHDFTLKSDNGLDTYDKLKSSLRDAGIEFEIPKWLEGIIDYYRLIRNHVAHNEDDDRKCQKAFEKIDIIQMCKQYPVFKGKAPNLPDKITMDDFYLYSASIKHVANLLTISIQGKENWLELGKYHPSLKLRNIAPGTDKRKFVNMLLSKLGHECIQKEVNAILTDIRSQQ